MTREQEYKILTSLFTNLKSTNSRLDKQSLLDACFTAVPELKETFDLINKFVNDSSMPSLGFTYNAIDTLFYRQANSLHDVSLLATLKFILSKLPATNNEEHKSFVYAYTRDNAEFWGPILNKTLRLGIGSSLLDADFSPMLAHRLDKVNFNKLAATYVITEKLDGNRCIVRPINGAVQLQSRNGKNMDIEHLVNELVKFYKLNKGFNYILDGEVMLGKDFSVSSGLINSKYKDKSQLCYYIFDFVDARPYIERRKVLSELINPFAHIKIVPMLGVYKPRDADSYDILYNLHNKIVQSGGEGLMLNDIEAPYTINKRVKDILKVKKVETYDLVVTGITFGTGKYAGKIGSLDCVGMHYDKVVRCNVGTGLTDIMRDLPVEAFIGKTIEVEAFQMTKAVNKDEYSLRFPRLKRIRTDKE